jgi:hypothetical protein
VDGRIVVENGNLRTLALEPVLERHRRIAARMLGRPARRPGRLHRRAR